MAATRSQKSNLAGTEESTQRLSPCSVSCRMRHYWNHTPSDFPTAFLHEKTSQQRQLMRCDHKEFQRVATRLHHHLMKARRITTAFSDSKGQVCARDTYDSYDFRADRLCPYTMKLVAVHHLWTQENYPVRGIPSHCPPFRFSLQ